MFTKFLPALALAIIFSVLIASAFGQTQQPPAKSSTEAAKTPAVNPLALTDAEKLDLANLANVAQQLDGALNARLKALLEISCGNGCDEVYVIGLAVSDARKFYRDQVQPLTERYSKRLAEIQKAHGCDGCAIDKGVFVKATK